VAHRPLHKEFATISRAKSPFPVPEPPAGLCHAPAGTSGRLPGEPEISCRLFHELQRVLSHAHVGDLLVGHRLFPQAEFQVHHLHVAHAFFGQHKINRVRLVLLYELPLREPFRRPRGALWSPHAGAASYLTWMEPCVVIVQV